MGGVVNPALLLVGLAVLTAAVAAGALWGRSVTARAWWIRRHLERVPESEVSSFLEQEVLRRYPPAKIRAILEYIARHPPASERDPRARAAVHQLTGRLYELLGSRRDLDRERRQELVRTLEERCRILDPPASNELPFGSFRRLAFYRAVAARDRCYLELLQAESLGHLAALGERLRHQLKIAEEAPPTPLVRLELLRGLLDVQASLEPYDRLHSADDQALFLGHALACISELHEELRGQREDDPTASLRLGELVLESLRQLVATALRGVHQRAELRLELLSKTIGGHREAIVVVELRNDGKGPASNVTVELLARGELFELREPRQHLRSLLSQQAARFEFLLIEPRVHDRARLELRLTWDDLDGRGHALGIADVVEFRPVRDLTFQPLLPNPHVVGRPLGHDDVFVGREAIFRLIVSSLRGVHQDNVVILIGQRRMGKTSILRRLPAHLGASYLPVLIDLQGFLEPGDTAFFRELAAGLDDELAAAGLPKVELDAAAFELDPAAAFRRGFLRQVVRNLGDRRLLLMLDEFEGIEDAILEGRLSAQILPWLRSLLQHEQGVSFLFAGTHRLDELTSDYWSVLFNLAVYIDIGHFSRTEVGDLLLAPSEGVFEIDPLALDKVYLLGGGHPHFSQLLARELVDFRNREKLSYVTVRDVNQVAERVVETGHLHLGHQWNEASRDERLLLLTVRELLERDSVASLGAAHRDLLRRRIDPGDLAAAAEHLARREILNDRAGQLSFRMDLLRLWLDRNHDLDTFRLLEDP